ncbi:hypothetical protein [Paenibacillus sp. FSL L8-0708]|uniref:hypothetical protein n=1 Tax=Paenibacillus sp. FSL L8-0708 TaxID=2975311 RepID=UPI0030FBEDC9
MTAKKQEIPSNALQQTKLAKKLIVSTRLISVWRNRGLPSEKMPDGTVWIDLDRVKEWLLEQKDERTKEHANKL